MCDTCGPEWPASIEAYDYTRVLSSSRWAWEYARRNQCYQRDWRIDQAGQSRPIKLTNGAELTRLCYSFPQAETWGLCMFCRSV